MHIVIPCLGCDQKLELPASAAGKKAKCPSCSTVFHVSAILPFEGPDPVVSPVKPASPEDSEPVQETQPNQVYDYLEDRPRPRTAQYMVVFGGIASIAVCLFAFVIAANREEEPQAPTQPKAQFAGDWNKASPQSVVPTVEDDGRKAGGDIRPLLPGGEYVYRRLLKSTVWIHREDGVTGTGTIIDQGGKFVLTAAHVVGNSEYVKVFFPISRNGKVVTSRSQHEILKDSETSAWATVVRRDGSKDLAILELASIPEGFTGLPIAKDSPSPGQPVHSLGACPTPGEAMWVYTSGAVRQVYQKVERIPNGQEVIELNATVVDTQSPINRGDSGGPLVNQRAELMGVACSFAGNAFLVSTFIELAEVHLFVDSFYAEEA